MEDIYSIAGHRFELISLHTGVHRLCSAYRAQGQPEFCIRITQRDIDQERDTLYAEPCAQGLPVCLDSEDYLETLAVHRKLADCLLKYDTLLFHGSAIAVDGKAYLFTGKSGTGKSTHARLWRELLGERALMVNDDKPLLKISADALLVCGSPWDGKHHLSAPVCLPLKSVCILEQAPGNSIASVSAAEAWPVLWQQCYRPPGAANLSEVLKLTKELVTHVSLYRLRCNTDAGAARLSYAAMCESEELRL